MGDPVFGHGRIQVPPSRQTGFQPICDRFISGGGRGFGLIRQSGHFVEPRIQHRFQPCAFFCARRLQPGQRRGQPVAKRHSQAVAFRFIGGVFDHLEHAAQAQHAIGAGGREAAFFAQRAGGGQDLSQRFGVHFDPLGPFGLIEREVEADRTARKTVGDSLARIRFQRIETARRADPHIEGFAVDAPRLPRPTGGGVPALGAGESGH